MCECSFVCAFVFHLDLTVKYRWIRLAVSASIHMSVRSVFHVCASPSVNLQHFSNREQQQAILSLLKPTRCTNVLNLFYFGMTLDVFRTVLPYIIRSSRLYIQQPNRYRCLLASRLNIQQPNRYCCLLASKPTPDDGRKDRPKHVECHSKIK